MQLQRFSNLFQSETSRLVKSFLNDNPDLLKKYVDGSVAAIGAVLTPLNFFMKHLLVVQGLNPDAVPGEKSRKEFQQALDSYFGQDHDKAFDDDYDLTWIQKRFDETRTRLKQLQLTKEKFMDLTDLANIPVPGHAYFADEPVEIVGDQTPTEKREFDIGANAIEALRKAVFDIEKEVGLPAKSKKKSGVKTAKKKLNKTTVKPVKRGPGVRVNRPFLPITEEKEYVDLGIPLQDEFKEKLSRSIKLVDDMVARDLVRNDDKDIKEQIAEIMKFDTKSLESLERVVKRRPVSFTGPFRRVTK
jgi:hypothetical protein